LTQRGPEGKHSLEYIDLRADVQSEPAQVQVEAGVSGLRVLYRGADITMPVTLSITTSTGGHRGVHMSRLVKAASLKRTSSLEPWLRGICAEVNRTQPGSRVSCSFELPFGDQFAEVTIRTSQRGAYSYTLAVDGMTACPCSKKMIGIGHMQRSKLTMVARSGRPIDIPGAAWKMSECFSALPKEELGRRQESEKILEAQANPRFAEDVVRECVKRFPSALAVSAKCFESIHAHDVVATWSSRAGLQPES
jgi:GTP cyclohydrolase FolE2